MVLLILNVFLLISTLIVRFAIGSHMYFQPMYYQPNQKPLFTEVRPEWIDLTSTNATMRYSDSLKLTLYANFDSPILPTSLKLTNSTQDILRDVKLSGGQAKYSARQLLIQPDFQFYPGRLQLELSYTNSQGEQRTINKVADLVFEDDFRSFPAPSDSKDQLWFYSQGIEVAKAESGSFGLICKPIDIEKTSLVFGKSYQNSAEVSVDFRPLTTTPNLSVSFDERTAFIIGDGKDNLLRFKHFVGKGHGYHEMRWPIPHLLAGRLYKAKLERNLNNFKIRITDSDEKEIASYSYSDPTEVRSADTHPYVAFWVFSNRGHLHAPAATEIRKVSIFFP